MNNVVMDEKYVAEIREQFKIWAGFLNGTFGLVSFTLALACLGTKTPVLNAWLSLAVVGYIRFEGKHFFPMEILRLRRAAKDDQASRILLNGLQKEFLGIKALIINYPVFLLGYILLCVVAAAPWLKQLIPSVGKYVGV